MIENVKAAKTEELEARLAEIGADPWGAHLAENDKLNEANAKSREKIRKEEALIKERRGKGRRMAVEANALKAEKATIEHELASRETKAERAEERAKTAEAKKGRGGPPTTEAEPETVAEGDGGGGGGAGGGEPVVV